MIIDVAPPGPLGSEPAVIRFEGTRGGQRTRPGRWLLLDGEPAFGLAFPCGTCQFLFERLEGARTTASPDQLSVRLAEGVAAVPAEVVGAFGSLLAPARYQAVLMSVRPELVRPGDDRDYFTHEQVATWGIDPTWGVPEDPRTPYYRTFETAIDGIAHLYEFVVPMVPPSWNDRDRVASSWRRWEVARCRRRWRCPSSTCAPRPRRARRPTITSTGRSPTAGRSPQGGGRGTSRPTSPAAVPARGRGRAVVAGPGGAPVGAA